GLINKLRAYQLQDQGFDTVDANERLGLPSEARDFPVAARMLDLLGVASIAVPWNTLLISVGLYIVIPVIAAQLWRR
ncbi:hypothetical protein ABTB58_20175, partial [Acinetobacter baumannii]